MVEKEVLFELFDLTDRHQAVICTQTDLLSTGPSEPILNGISRHGHIQLDAFEKYFVKLWPFVSASVP